MNVSEIIDEVHKLPHAQRREIARRIFEMEEDAECLDYYTHLANQQFLDLDRLEAANVAKRTG